MNESRHRELFLCDSAVGDNIESCRRLSGILSMNDHILISHDHYPFHWATSEVGEHDGSLNFLWFRWFLVTSSMQEAFRVCNLFCVRNPRARIRGRFRFQWWDGQWAQLFTTKKTDVPALLTVSYGSIMINPLVTTDCRISKEDSRKIPLRLCCLLWLRRSQCLEGQAKWILQNWQHVGWSQHPFTSRFEPYKATKWYPCD